MARKMGKVHLTSRGASKVTNPDVSSIDRAMAKALRGTVGSKTPSIMSEVSKYAGLLTQDKDRKGGYGKITKVF